MAKSDNVLKSTVERVERLLEEKKAITDDINVVMAEGKALGLDPKVVREIIRLRKMDPDDLKARNALLEEYAEMLGLDLL